MRRVNRTLRMLIGVCVGAAAVLGGRAEGTEIKVLSAGAVKAVVTELAVGFGRETGHTVTLSFDTVGALRKRVTTESADVLILTDAAIDELTRQGIVAPGTRSDIARVGIGVAVKEGAARPDISTPDALKQTLLSVKSLVYVDPARGATSGIHFASVLERLGIADAVKDKTVLWPGGFAAEAVAKGQAELCVHQISEILPVPGVVLVGPLPKELQKITTYSGGVDARSAAPDAARALLAFLARPAFKAKFAAAGLDYKEN
jgi:molybdate transport system substrate-binding protein